MMDNPICLNNDYLSTAKHMGDRYKIWRCHHRMKKLFLCMIWFLYLLISIHMLDMLLIPNYNLNELKGMFGLPHSPLIFLFMKSKGANFA